MTKLLPFPARSVRTRAKKLLRLTASFDRLSKPDLWAGRPTPPEALGNMLQRLARERPYAIVALESIVAELLQQIDKA